MGKLKKSSTLPAEFVKSVQAIEARLSFNYLEQCIFDTSLATVKDIYQDGHVRKGFSFHAKDLPGFVANSGSAYQAAHKSVDNIRTAAILYKPYSGAFVMINLYSSIGYDNGRFFGCFTDEAVKCGIVSPGNKYLKVKAGYNLFASDELYAWRLSEFLKDRTYRGRDEDGYYHRQISINDLRAILGLVNTQNSLIMEELKLTQEGFDIDKMVDTLMVQDEKEIKPKRKKLKKEAQKNKVKEEDLNIPPINVQYPRFAIFKSNVLDPAIETINQKKILKIYDCEYKTGGHGKIEAVDFKFDTVINGLPERELNELCNDMDNFLISTMTVQQKKELLKAANYSLRIVQEKYEYMLDYKKKRKVNSEYHFVLDAIKRDYNTKTVEEPGSTPFDNVFTKLWERYPKPTRKDLVRKKNIKDIEDIGFEKMEQCFNNYLKSVHDRRENGFKRLQYMSGGAFFSGGYTDYLPENFDKTVELEKVEDTKNGFHNFDERKTDYDAILKQRQGLL